MQTAVESKQQFTAAGFEKQVVTLDMVRADPYVQAYIRRADDQMGVLGYTEHGERHAALVSRIAYNVLARLGYPERTAELAAIAGYLHDIGNLVHRRDHPISSALLALEELRRMQMDPTELALVLGAIGSHEEESGDPVSEVSAAVIIADKSDVARTRVRDIHPSRYDEHDRVNYATISSSLRVNHERTLISLTLEIDTQIAPIMEYFELFLQRMVMARRAALTLGCQFELVINGTKLL